MKSPIARKGKRQQRAAGAASIGGGGPTDTGVAFWLWSAGGVLRAVGGHSRSVSSPRLLPHLPRLPIVVSILQGALNMLHH